MFFFLFILILPLTYHYIDIPFNYQAINHKILYTLNFTLQHHPRIIPLLLHNQFAITNISQQSQQIKTQFAKKNAILGQIEVSSIQGYSLQGWKRYIEQVLFFKDQRRYFNITLDQGPLEQNSLSLQNKQRRSLTLGPQLTYNHLFNKIKDKFVFIKDRFIGVYHGLHGEGRIQIGGYQQIYAKRNNSDTLLLQKINYTIKDIQKQSYYSFVTPLIILRYFNMSTFSQYPLSKAQTSLIIDSNLPQIQLPQSQISILVSSLNQNGCGCISPNENNQYLTCSNFSDIKASLTYISLSFNNKPSINISMRLIIKEKSSNSFTFYITEAKNQSQMRIGAILFKDYYLVLDLDNQLIMYSPINHTKPEFNSVFIFRFILYFVVFLILLSIAGGIYNLFYNSTTKNQITLGQHGIEMSTYERPVTMDFQ